jgi:hypothetical protein
MIVLFTSCMMRLVYVMQSMLYLVTAVIGLVPTDLQHA